MGTIAQFIHVDERIPFIYMNGVATRTEEMGRAFLKMIFEIFIRR